MNALVIGDAERETLVRYLNKVSFFSSMSNVDFKRLLVSFDLVAYGPGETVIEAGAHEDGFYIVHKGKVEVWGRKMPLMPLKKVAELGPGEFIGEIAIVEHCKRKATVKTVEPTEMFRFQSTHTATLFADNPAFKDAFLRLAKSRKA